MAIPREKILARRKRLAARQAKFRKLQEQLRAEERRLASLDRKREEAKLKIIGRIFQKRMETDAELKAWFDAEVAVKVTAKAEREVLAFVTP